MNDDDLIFNYAENEEGRIVHVDEVPRGKACNCHCPCCQEQLEARHGDKKQHGFAHLSQDRRANLQICYEVTMYKLAEQLIQERKRIWLPSYYNIFPEREVEFVKVEVNRDYDREDRQPDIIATTEDGQQYIIELYFGYKAAGHCNEIDYESVNCIEIDLTGQTLNSIKTFISSRPNEKWKWVNNQSCFEKIVDRYKQDGKNVEVVDIDKCGECAVKDLSCAKFKEGVIVEVKHNGKYCRICKIDSKREQLAKKEQERQEAAVKHEKRKSFVDEKFKLCVDCRHRVRRLHQGDKIFCNKHKGYVDSDEASECTMKHEDPNRW